MQVRRSRRQCIERVDERQQQKEERRADRARDAEVTREQRRQHLIAREPPREAEAEEAERLVTRLSQHFYE